MCALVALAAADVPLAKRQQDVNHLLWKIYDHLHFDDLKGYASSFDPEGDTSIYKDGGEAARHLAQELKDHRLLEQHH
ncbi:hypothetical protein, partial [Salmonella enterica]|uniref:hypothetical protein n=1 Tax=Salmonella enterica TaxID=28901 RepID=UPI0032978147